MSDQWDSPPRPAPPQAYAGESVGSLLLGAAIFGYAGFALQWLSPSAWQYAMWVLRVLAIAFAVTLVFVLVAPRLGALLRLIVIGLAAVLLSSAGVWLLWASGGRDLYGWLLIIMGAFDAMEIWRYIAARRAAGG